MKKKIVSICLVMVVLAAALCSQMFAFASPVKENSKVSVESGVLTARFEHMLNLNRVFGDMDELGIIEESAIALFDFAEENENGDMVIKSSVLSAFIKNMYGFDADLKKAENDCIPIDEGYTAIAPKGIDRISQTVISFMENEDGTYSVISDMVVSHHDGGDTNHAVMTVFEENASSTFGFNIISSNIL